MNARPEPSNPSNQNTANSDLSAVAAQADLAGGWLEGVGKYHWIVFIGCWLGGIFDGMDSTLMSVIMPTALGDLLGSTDKAVVGPIAGYVMSVFLLGWAAGGVLFGIIGDKLGRVKSMVLSILLYAAFTGLGGFAHTWPQLAACRFLTGLGIGGELVSISTFLAEVWPARSRALAIGVLITSYQAGVFIAGSLNTVVHDWRHAFFYGAAPAVLVIFLRSAMRESDKWVAAREQHLQNKNKGSHLQQLFDRRHCKGLVVGGVAFAGLLVGYWASLSWIPLWIQDLLRDSGAGNERGIATMYQGIAAMLGCCLAGVFSDWMGRRPTIIFSFLGSFMTSCLLFLTNSAFTPIVYWECALLGFFIGLAQAVMYIYLPELFPTLVRASTTGFCLNVGRLVTVISVFFVGDLIHLILKLNLGETLLHIPGLSAYGVAAFLFAFSYLLAIVAVCFGDETRGKALLD